ncbi:MAG: hypothetical protein JNK87_37465 [Bryobacterales bacterium]|nr:hypothetical protein [Bryobacterales bacterium]
MEMELGPETVDTPHPVLDKCDYFTDVQLWPASDILDSQGWLTNFRDNELPYAIRLLDFFMYFSERVVDALLYSAFQRLSSVSPDHSGPMTGLEWRSFVDTALLTYVTGEDPNVTDSGFTFARKARQVLGVSEGNVVAPDAALQRLLQAPRPVVFVDDFVGSGSQCIRTWLRPYPAFANSTRSFADIAQLTTSKFYYCPVVSTAAGMRNVRRYCHGLHLAPAHVLDGRYSVLSAKSLAWDSATRQHAIDVVRKASQRAGIPDTRGRDVNDWQGFHKLGLAIAFHNSVPDATIPLFHWANNGWIPLVRRR